MQITEAVLVTAAGNLVTNNVAALLQADENVKVPIVLVEVMMGVLTRGLRSRSRWQF